jgi:preprotein translocase subunit SecE
MATKKNTKGARRRKPKGKRLSDALAKKDAQKLELEQQAAEAEQAAQDEALAADEEVDADGLDSMDDEAPSGDGLDSEDDEQAAALEYGGFDDEDSDEDSLADDEEPLADDEEPLADDEEWEYEDEGLMAAQMGNQRYVLFGFMALWLVTAYISGRTVEAVWSSLAAKDWFVLNMPSFLTTVPHEGLVARGSISLLVGGLLAGFVVWFYFRNANTRQWADEVAEELTKVDWPSRKQIGNHTVVVIAASAVITAYLALLDRFWSFVTNLIYSAGA